MDYNGNGAMVTDIYAQMPACGKDHLYTRGYSFYSLELLDSSCVYFNTLQKLVGSGLIFEEYMISQI